jgi:hypothetical protein
MLRGDKRSIYGFLSGFYRSLAHEIPWIPESAFPDPGEGFKLAFLKMKGCIQGFKAAFNIIGSDHIGGQFIAEGIDVDVGI